MKAIVFGLMMATSVAHAKVDVTAMVSHGFSTEVESTDLINLLRSNGIKGYVDSSKHESLKLKGKITQVNGAVCDNGQFTYHVELTELDEKDKEVQQLDINDQDCSGNSVSKRINDVLNNWGGGILEGDCGMGHCWSTIRSIECTHFDADKIGPAFDSCDVLMSSGQEE
jgi:hypothetical protein